MKMKTIFNLLVFGLILSCSSTKNIQKENTNTFKTITEASYSSKRSGELTREKALNQKINRKEIYNEQGNLIEYWRYETDGTIYEKTKLTKKKEGKLIKSITFDKNGNLKKDTATVFDKNGKIIEYKTYNSDDELISLQKNEYDTNGNRISLTNSNVKSNRTFKTTNEYNSKNQQIKETDFKPDGTIKDVRTYKYDTKGNEIESELSRPNGDYTKFISTYNEQNHILTQYWYDKDGKQKHSNNWEYNYDKNNNWITKKRFSKGELGYVWERQIEYK
jgi:hypothetical protein